MPNSIADSGLVKPGGILWNAMSFTDVMKILVTAFGPFDGRVENASSLALAGLKRRLPEIRMRVLPVDSVIAPARIKQAIRLLRPDALVMLGEAVGTERLRIEDTAWNELDFRIPDIAGRQPELREIAAGMPASLSSTLPVDSVLARLMASGHDAERSSDPGRYLCNQVFFTALMSIRNQRLPCRAGFIHLPLARDLPTSRVVEALGDVIDGIADWKRK